ncbi:hypothetical protein SAMN04489726_0988 [Allokutzneria albata]|uniref:Uncharacterized protein n=1 Tax=Allokutzneria albata TaxID=211114 RepID=A0A1G9SBA5_ALLAB|nr:hypothetical protein SAMN04489726_0988 [Allokutzneria albata]
MHLPALDASVGADPLDHHPGHMRKKAPTILMITPEP